MTQGKPLQLILMFAMPLMLGNILQELYTIVDTIVVGQFLGVKALASMGAASWIQWMFLSVVMGFAQGFSIKVANLYGANDQQGISKTIANIIISTVVLAVVLTIISEVIVSPLLHLLQTPNDIIQGAIVYLRIIAGGISITLFYNLLSCILRAFGNSKAPLFAMIIAAGLNIGLDLLFVCVFHVGIAGAAIATLLSQLFASGFCLFILYSSRLFVLKKGDFKINKSLIRELIKLGFPLALQNGIISIGGMIVQFVINSYGFVFVAGFTATNKLYGLLETAAVSYGYALTTYNAQNYGAKKYQRIKDGVRISILVSIATAIVIGLIMIIFGRNILMLFISGNKDVVIKVLEVAYHYLFIMSVCLPILYVLHTYRNALQGLGNTFIPMCSGIVELVMRVMVALLLPLLIGREGIYYAEIMAWSGAALLLYISYKNTKLGE